MPTMPTQRVGTTDINDMFSTVLESVLTPRPVYGNNRTRNDSSQKKIGLLSAEPRIERLQTKEDENYCNRSGTNMSATSNGLDGPRQIYYNKPAPTNLSHRRSNESKSSRHKKSASSRNKSEDSRAVIEEVKARYEPYLTKHTTLSSDAMTPTARIMARRMNTERENSLLKFL